MSAPTTHPGAPGAAGPSGPFGGAAGPGGSSGGPGTPGGRAAIRWIVLVAAALAVLVTAVFTLRGFVHDVRLKADSTRSDLPANLTGLVIDVPNAQVDVQTKPAAEAGATGTVVLSYQGVGTQVPTLEVVQDGTVATLEVSGGPGDDWTWMFDRETELVVTVPEGTAKNVDLDVRAQTGTADIEGEFRDVTIDAASGAVDADVVTRALTVDAETGYVHVEGRARTATVSTRTGAISVDQLDVAEKITLSSDRGFIEAELGDGALPAQGIEVTSDAGAVDLEVPRIADVANAGVRGYTVDATSDNGAVNVEIERLQMGTEEPHVPIIASSDSGAITVGYAR